MRLAGTVLFVLICLQPAWAELTFLSDVDKHASIELSADKLSPIYSEYGLHSIRSTKAVAPGSGFFYFEGTRLDAPNNYGFAVSTAAHSLDAGMGLTDQAVGVNVLGWFWSSNSWQGNVPNPGDTYGIAVDYRGTNPIIHVIGAESDAADAAGVYLGNFTLDQVTDPVYIALWGGRTSANQIRQRINAGDDLGGNPFRFDPVQVLTEAYYHHIEGIDELVPGWGVPDPSLNVFPVLTPGGAQTVVLGNPATVSGSAADAEDGDLSNGISFTADEGANAVGSSLTYTPLTSGDHYVDLVATDSTGASVGARVTVTVIPDGSVDNDNDGLSYDQEILLGTDPSVPDSDGDGLLDGKEGLYGANPQLADSDGDGMGDRYEALNGTQPDVDDLSADPDNDGFDNAAEFNGGSHPLKADSIPTTGVVLLNPADKHANADLSADGLTVTFSAAKAPGTMAVRGDVAVNPGSGWYYYEGTRLVGTGNYGFGVAAAAEALTSFGGETNLSVGVFTNGDVYYNGALNQTFPDIAETTTYGLAVDYSGANPTVYPIVADATGWPAVLSPITMTGMTDPLHIFVFGESGAQGTINAGADPANLPFVYPAAYEIYDQTQGPAGAEFLGSGWGPDHAYVGQPEPVQFDRVFLDPEFTPAGLDINLGPEQLSASYTHPIKMAIRANTGMIGQFRYWEAARDMNTGNYGMGYITAHAYLSPYCCVTASLLGAEPSMSVNASANVWRNLVSQTAYDLSNTHYGFAVDYRGSRPIVYVIIGDDLTITLNLDDIFTPIFPMLYGNAQGFERTNSANFGAEPFAYDVRAILNGEGIDTSELILGWGDPNDGETPVISGQEKVTVAEEGSLEILLSHLEVSDPSTAKRGALTLTVMDGTNYSRSNNTLTVPLDFNGNIVVPVKVDDGVFESKVYDLIVEVTPVNDPPVLTGLAAPLAVNEETTLSLSAAMFAGSDVDNDFPGDMSISVGDGANYTHTADSLTPVLDFNGTLTVPITLNDGSDNSNTVSVSIEVDPVNDRPIIDNPAAPLATDEETPLSIELTDLLVTDPDNSYPGDYTLSVGDGEDYSRTGNTVTPELDFNGVLFVPVTVNDGTDDSEIFQLEVTVDPVNDLPVVDGQTPLKTRRNMAITPTLDHFLVTDPDNDYPDDFVLIAGDGANYTRVDNTITPALDFSGNLTVPITVNDGTDNSTSFNATIEICVPPQLDLQPVAQSVCEGEIVSFSVSVSGPGPFAYQWRKDGTPIAGAGDSEYSLVDPVNADSGSYDCLITNACDTEASTAVSLVVNTPMNLVQEPENLTLCPEDDLILSVSAGGSLPITYQWYKDGNPIPLATAASYIRDNLSSDDNGVYTCELNNVCGTLVTTEATVLVDGPLEAQIQASTTAAGLSPLSLSAQIGCALPDVSYQWRDVTRGLVLDENVSPLIIDPLPTATTIYELAVTDSLKRETTTARVPLLVSQNNAYLDLDGDGCNDEADLWLLGADWRETISAMDDPNGDGMIDVRDLLYIDTSANGSGCTP